MVVVIFPSKMNEHMHLFDENRLPDVCRMITRHRSNPGPVQHKVSYEFSASSVSL